MRVSHWLARLRPQLSRHPIESSGLFDRAWYLAQYPDVAESRIDPVVHFLTYGAAEGRSPGPDFNAIQFNREWYLAQYSDVAKSGIDPVVHYLSSGFADGRSPGPAFNAGERSGAEAKNLCEQEAVTTEEALETITSSRGKVCFTELFRSISDASAQRCERCPVTYQDAVAMNLAGAGDMDLIYTLVEHIQAKRVVETGVAYGWSSLAILSSIRRRPGALLVSTDRPYPNLKNASYVGVAVPKELYDHWVLIRKPDRLAIREALLLTGPIDLCHYDSDKSYAGRMFAYPKLWAALRPGGIFISDDIEDNVAFFDFSSALQLPRVIIKTPEEKLIGVLKKPFQ
jgi:predicted O-methyltransferase YrrM